MLKLFDFSIKEDLLRAVHKVCVQTCHVVATTAGAEHFHQMHGSQAGDRFFRKTTKKETTCRALFSKTVLS